MFNTDKEIVREMLELQDNFNKRVHPKWREQNYDWDTAIVVEASESIDSIPSLWKWWRKGEDDLENFKVEIIDIWHFVMGKLMVTYSKAYCSNIMLEALDNKIISSTNKISLIKELIDNTLNNESRLLYTLSALSSAVGIHSIKDLYKEYLVKNVLNKIRQDNGYKEGTYVKIWNQEHQHEDNFYAYNIANELEDLSFDNLYTKIQDKYNKVTNKGN